MIIMPALVIFSCWNRGGTSIYSKWKHPIFALRDGSLSICVPKAMALHQEIGAMCKNQLTDF